MRGNQFYTVFGIVAAVLLGGAGFYCFKGHSSFKDAGGEFKTRRTNLLRLKKSQPYPNEENLKRIEKEVAEYETEIKGLFESLDRFQQPLNTSLDSTEFLTTLKAKFGAFKALAKEKGLKIENEEEFYMGMDAYRAKLPDSKAVPLLYYQLSAIEYLLNMLAEEGATGLISLQRELLPVEMSSGGGEGEASTTVVAKYPVSLTFESKHPAFVEIVNKITNDNKYFFILRALRVDNSEKEGVPKGGNEESVPRYVNAQGLDAPQDLLSEIPQDLSVPDQVNWMKEKGYELQSSDARILLGNESLRAFMVIDVVRFADASKKIAKGGSPDDKEGEGKDDAGQKKK